MNSGISDGVTPLRLPLPPVGGCHLPDLRRQASADVVFLYAYAREMGFRARAATGPTFFWGGRGVVVFLLLPGYRERRNLLSIKELRSLRALEDCQENAVRNACKRAFCGGKTSPFSSGNESDRTLAMDGWADGPRAYGQIPFRNGERAHFKVMIGQTGEIAGNVRAGKWRFVSIGYKKTYGWGLDFWLERGACLKKKPRREMNCGSLEVVSSPACHRPSGTKASRFWGLIGTAV